MIRRPVRSIPVSTLSWISTGTDSSTSMVQSVSRLRRTDSVRASGNASVRSVSSTESMSGYSASRSGSGQG